MLISMTTIALTIGPLIVFSLGTILEWRNIALYCCVTQICTTIALSFVSQKTQVFRHFSLRKNMLMIFKLSFIFDVDVKCLY